VGSGLSDKERRKPPKIGSIIVYRCQELSDSGSPRFPTFVGVAADKTEPKDPDFGH
ncbi:6078_t:CDS:2, partial [Dentiscutata heterogama]